MSAAVAVRFWAKVDRRGDDECWVWTGATSEKGYGRFGLEGKNRHAHQVAYLLTSGTIPDGLWVLHHCDNRPCVNPAHLYAGTPAQNLADAVSRGRWRWPGPNNAKITRDNAMTIRASALPNKELAATYGITADTVRRIKKGDSWA